MACFKWRSEFNRKTSFVRYCNDLEPAVTEFIFLNYDYDNNEHIDLKRNYV